jgi:hypothetical protein
MKKNLIILVSNFLLLCSSQLLYAEQWAVKYNGGTSKNELYLVADDGTSTLKKSWAFDSNSWSPNDSYTDSITGIVYMLDSSDATYVTYNPHTNTITKDVTNGYVAGYQKLFPKLKTVSDIIENTTNADGDDVTKIKSLEIVDSTGDTMIKVTSDGATHIGENSLVTQEVNGRQELYATNSGGNQIDLNIKKGTNLLIDGVNVMDAIHGSVAMGAAMASLPTSAGDAQYTCGLGTGFHNSSTAISGGCGFDFKNFDFVETMPKAFHDASFNFGVASVVEGEQDGASLKAGITFKFGAPKKIKTAEAIQFRTENKIDAVMLQNKKVMDENALLKDQIAAINLKLDTLNMVASN